MPHKISEAMQIRALINGEPASCTDQITEPGGDCTKPTHDCCLPFENNDSNILHFDRYFDQKFPDS